MYLAQKVWKANVSYTDFVLFQLKLNTALKYNFLNLALQIMNECNMLFWCKNIRLKELFYFNSRVAHEKSVTAYIRLNLNF